MIKELSELGKKLREQNSGKKLIHNALKEEPVSIDLVIKKDGSFHSFVPFEKRMTTAEAIIAKKGKARLLLDKAEEVLGYGGEKSNKKHDLFLAKIVQYQDLAELKPVSLFYWDNKKNGVERALVEFEKAIPDEKEQKGNIAFRILSNEKHIHEEANIVQEIIERYESAQKAFLSKSKILCSVCGENNYSVNDTPHGMIKKVPDGQPSGCALVSYNTDAFESYGLEGNYNSAICTNCAKTYVEGLNWLLSNGNPTVITDKNKKEKEIFKYTNRKNFGPDTAMVFWTRENAQLKELDLLDSPDSEQVVNLIDSVIRGDIRNKNYIETDQFYSCTLSGSAARISVRDWIESSLTDYRKNIAQWFQDIATDYYDPYLKKNQIYYSRLYELARSCQNEKEDKKVMLSRIATYLWNAALKNTAPPLWILTLILNRARVDGNGVTRERAALIQLILKRNTKGGDFMCQEKASADRKSVAYVCGQVFAALENIQRAAMGVNVNAGIRERYFTFAMTTPSPAFGRLFNLSSKHFTKLKGEKPGLAVVLDKELQGLCKEIKIEEFPLTFTLEEQGMFALGYYHQKQAQFNRKELKEITEEE